MHLYLAGPMRNLPEFNFPAFFAAELELRAKGHTVFNPARRDVEDGFNPKTDACKPMSYYMAIDLPEVCRADAVAVLPGWQYSQGATLEVLLARICGIPVLDVDTLQPVAMQPQETAFLTVHEILRGGLNKHASDSWRHEAEDHHLRKVIGHAIKHMEERDGSRKPDGEPHLANMLCRAAMVMAKGA